MCADPKEIGAGSPFRKTTIHVSIETTVITGIDKVPAISWPAGWEAVEVVDGVIVEEPPSEPPGPAGPVYNRFGRVPDAERYGRLVSLLA
jgi:hypothetical protein